eukprot:gene26664-35340_t
MRFFQSYSAYKLHTNSFVGWVIEAAKECNVSEDLLLCFNSSNNTTGSVNNIGKIVEHISKVDFLSFSRTTQTQFYSALINCQEAIKLREKVSAFYRLSDKESASVNDDCWERHEYFIKCLRIWHNVLSTTFAGSNVDGNIGEKAGQSTHSPYGNKKFEGFHVLQDDSSDDEEIGENDTDGCGEDLQQPRRSEIQSTGTSFTAASEFAEDLKLQLQCFVMDMDELLDQVCKSWGEVKAGNIPSFTASAVTTAAITSVQSLFAELQLSYPSIHTYTDLHAVIVEFVPQNFLFKSTKGLQIACKAAQDCKFVRQFHAKGAAWLEAYSVSVALYAFQNVCSQASDGVSLILRDGYYNGEFDEDSESGIIPWVLLDKSLEPAAVEDNGTGKKGTGNGQAADDKERFWVFLARELAVLRDFMLIHKAQSFGAISDPFLKIMRAFLVEGSHEISVPLVFASLCWVKSVMFLQGNCFIKRTVTLARAKLRNIHEHSKKSLQRKHISKANVGLHKFLVQLSVDLQLLLGNNCAFFVYWRNNPYMANCLVLDYYVRYLEISCEALHITSRFRAFGHLYFALLQRKLIDKIPCMDEILGIYDKMIFYPSRPSLTNFFSTYLMSSHMTALAVRDSLHPKVPSGQQQKKSTANQQAKLKPGDIKVRHSMHSFELSEIVAFFCPSISGHNAKKKKSAVVKDANSLSEVVKNVKEIMGFELLGSRVLSRNMLFLNDELSELFERIVDILGARESYNLYLSNEAELTLQERVNRAAENSIMLPLLPFLDSLSDEGDVVAATAVANTGATISVEQGKVLLLKCKQISQEIKRTFSAMKYSDLYIFEKFPAEVARAYGTASILDYDLNAAYLPPGYNTLDAYKSWMDRFDFDPSPLSTTEVQDFKDEVRRDPFLISHYCSERKSTILHHLVSNPHARIDLVEFALNMGAMTFQKILQQASIDKSAFYDPENRDEDYLQLYSKLPSQWEGCHAICLAVADNQLDIVRLMLEVDRYKCLNERMKDTGDSLVHIAVKHGHKELFGYLNSKRAKLNVQNRDGKKVFEMTSDRSWQAELRKCYQDYVREIEVADSYVPKNQLLSERFHQLETDAIQSIKEQQFQEDSEVHNQPQSNSSKKGLAPSSTAGDTSSNNTSVKKASDDGNILQGIFDIRDTVPELLLAWKSSGKDRLMAFWAIAPRARKEAILRQACPLLVQSIDDQFSIINGNKVYPQSFKQEIILEIERKLTIENLVNELPDLLDEFMNKFSWYTAKLVKTARTRVIPNLGITVYTRSIPVGKFIVTVGTEIEHFGISKVVATFTNELLVQHGFVCSVEEFGPVLLVLQELLELQVGVLNQL